MNKKGEAIVDFVLATGSSFFAFWGLFGMSPDWLHTAIAVVTGLSFVFYAWIYGAYR